MSLDIKKIAVPLVLAIFFVSIDRFFKILALNHFQDEEIRIIGEYLKFNFAKNYNIAFSLPISGIIIETIIPIVIFFLVYNIITLAKKNSYRDIGCLTIILFGAISNYVDRIKFGFVIDYIDLKYFTVFNVADSMIVTGVLVLIIFNFRKNES